MNKNRHLPIHADRIRVDANRRFAGLAQVLEVGLKFIHFSVQEIIVVQQKIHHFSAATNLVDVPAEGEQLFLLENQYFQSKIRILQ